MRSVASIALASFLFAVTFMGAAFASGAEPLRLDRITVPFLENRGQTDPRVSFYASTFSGTVFLTRDGEIVYSFATAAARGSRSSIVERFINGKTSLRGIDESPGRISFIRGKGGRTEKSTSAGYEAISLGEVYPGITVELRARGKEVEKIYTAAPGSDPAAMRMELAGAQSLEVDQQGNLVVTTPAGVARLSAPLAWQVGDAGRVPRQVGYALYGNNRYGFKVAGYDPTKALVIDPILQSTYLGGSASEAINAVAVHPTSGEVYVAGYTASTDFPGITGGSTGSCTNCPNQSDALVARVSGDLKTLRHAVYLGGSVEDYAKAIAIDSVTGDVYVTGLTGSADFPGTAGGADSRFSYPWEVTEAFVARFSGDLGTLLQSTYLGGANYDEGTAIAVHPQTGDVYVAGGTSSADFPGVTVNSADANCAFCSYSAQLEGFVSRLSNDLKTIYQSTYLGGTGNDSLNALAISSVSGDVYVAGQTRAWDLPFVAGGADVMCDNCSRSGEPFLMEGFITRLSPSLLNDGRVQSTFLGGNATDYVYAIAVHPATGDVYAAGTTLSYDFPGISALSADSVCESCFIPPAGATDSFEGFVSRLSPDLKTIRQSTYLGGATDDYARSLAIHPVSGDILVAGTTDSRNFPGIAGGAYTTLSFNEAFVSRLRSDLQKVYQSSFVGGPGMYDYGHCVAVNPRSGEVYLAGTTTSNGIPGIAGGIDETAQGYEAYITRFDSLSSTYAVRFVAGVGGSLSGSILQSVLPNGSTTAVTAVPASGYGFDNWTDDSGGVVGTANPITITGVRGDRTLTAKFSVRTPTGYSISGAVRSGSATGPVLAGAVVAIAGKSALSSSTGTFSITGIAAGTYTLSVSRTGYKTYTASYVLNANKSGVTFVLTPLYNLNGTVRSGSANGPVVAGAIVKMAGKSMVTTSTGTFSLVGIPAGTYTLAISKSGYKTYVTSYVLNGNKSGATFVLAPLYNLSGTVRSGSATGPVLAGAVVTMAGKSVVTSSTGTFSLVGIPAGTYTLAISKSGYKTYAASYILNANKSGASFVLTPLYNMSGTVRSGSATGPVLAGAVVSIAGKSSITTSTGTFSLLGIPAGTYTLTITRSGYKTLAAPYLLNGNKSGLVFSLSKL